MNNLGFFLKNYLKKPVLWLIAAVILVVTLFAFQTKKMVIVLPCAVYSCDETKEAQEVVSYLQKKDFFVCAKEEEVFELIQTGRADCGLIIEEHFSEMLQQDCLERCARFLTSERSLQADKYKLMAAVAIYRQLMPSKATNLAEKFGYPAKEEELLFYEEQIKDWVNPLTFEITSVKGETLQNTENYDLEIGTVAILCFVMFGMMSITVVRKRSEGVKKRFHSSLSYYKTCILPQCVALGILIFAASVLGILFSTVFRSIPVLPILLALALYLLVLTILFSLLSMLRIPPQILICIIAIEAALSLILCPLYQETALLIGLPYRWLSVPYLMFRFLFW